ncbi:MAG: PhoH family protein [Methyloligellaceae bacterium]
MTTPSTYTPAETLVIPFDDNRLAAELFGEYDSNLAMIEDRLDIQAVAHGNVVTLHGEEGACTIARDVLESLYARLEAGESLSAGDIDGAIRHAGAALSAPPMPRGSRSPAATGDAGARTGGGVAQIRTRKRLITARTPMQSEYIHALENEDLIFSTGPAGTGKTYLAVAYAAAALERGSVDRLILSRPAVEAGERLGFLPGDMRDKVDPYLRPLYDALYDVAGPDRVERGLESGAIEIAPLAFMRGRTLSHAIVILDEAQNCTPVQMKMFLTRLGEGSKMVVTGDPTQIDLPSGQHSGLSEAVGLLEGIRGITHCAFGSEDVVRRELVSRIVAAYEGEP